MGELHIFGYGGSIHIGNDCFVGPGSRIWSGENITIGNSVFISHNVNVVDTNSHETNHIERHDAFIKFIKDGYPKDKGSIATKPIVIEDHAWISFGATILKGVTVGKGAIVAAGSIVTKDVPAFAVVAGNPATVVKQLASR